MLIYIIKTLNMEVDMKKVFKGLLAGALVLPCAFAFVGCGDNNVHVDVSGNYSKVDATEAKTEIENYGISFEGSGLRYTSVSDVKVEVSSLGSFSTKATSNVWVVFDEQNNVTYKVEINMNGDGAAMGIADTKINLNMTAYMTNNTIYCEYNGQKLAHTLGSPVETEDELLENILNSISSNVEMTNFMPQFIQYLSDSGAEVKKAENGTTVKYQITTSEQAGMNVDMYLVVKDGNFAGFKTETVMTQSTQGMTMTMNATADMENYTGNITLPDLSSYTQI